MITTLSLSPAVDKIYFADNFEVGGLYRVKDVIKTAGGKGINVARVAAILGEKVCSAGFKAGETGNWLEAELTKLGVDTRFVEIAGESRTNNNIIDRVNGTETEVLEIGPAVTDGDIRCFTTELGKALTKTTVLVCSGGLPLGVNDDFYRKQIDLAKAKGIKTLLDTSGNVLVEGVKAGPYMVKPNLRELSNYAGHLLNSMDDIINACKRILLQGVEVVLASMGREGALLVSHKETLHARVYGVKVVNTIGSGDSMVAGFASGLARGYTHEESFRLAMACAVTNAEYMEIGYIDRERVDEYLYKIVLESIEETGL